VGIDEYEVVDVGALENVLDKDDCALSDGRELREADRVALAVKDT
jgi:hypothetical protein